MKDLARGQIKRTKERERNTENFLLRSTKKRQAREKERAIERGKGQREKRGRKKEEGKKETEKTRVNGNG